MASSEILHLDLSPHLPTLSNRKDNYRLEQVQLKNTKILMELRPVKCDKKLREHGLFSLEKRRLGGRWGGRLIIPHIYKEVTQKMKPRL